MVTNKQLLITSIFFKNWWFNWSKNDDCFKYFKTYYKGTIENVYNFNGEYEVIEAEIIETSELINKEIKIQIFQKIKIGAVLRDKIIIPSPFCFKKDDRVVFIVKRLNIFGWNILGQLCII